MSHSPRPRSATFVYSCGCVRRFDQTPPKIGDLLTCLHHGSVTVTCEEKQWSVICEHIGCKFGNVYGVSGMLAAERAAAMHRRRISGHNHPVGIWRPNGELHRRFDGAGAADAPHYF